MKKENIKEKNVNTTVKTKPYFGYNFRIVVNLVVILFSLFIGAVLLLSSFTIKARSNVVYNQNSNVDYRVFLKENDYYRQRYLDKNMTYIASLIDYVDADFNYSFNTNELIDYKYSYYIDSYVKVVESDDDTKVIYSKTDKLVNIKTQQMTNSTGFSIKENLKINYDKYNNLIKSFKTSYGISAKSAVDIKLYVRIEDSTGKIIRDFGSGEVVNLSIPLTEQMIDIKMESNGVSNSNNTSVYKDFSIENKTALILSIICFVIFVISIVWLMLFLNKTKKKKTIYDLTLDKILREYDRVIVNSKKAYDDESNAINVSTFDELLDVRDNLEKPIIFSEVHKGQKAIFLVKSDIDTYRYVLKLADLEKAKKK